MAEDGDVDSRIAEYHKQLNLLSSKEWFYTDLSEDQADVILKTKGHKSFLVSTNDRMEGCFSLYLHDKSNVSHFLIQQLVKVKDSTVSFTYSIKQSNDKIFEHCDVVDVVEMFLSQSTHIAVSGGHQLLDGSNYSVSSLSVNDPPPAYTASATYPDAHKPLPTVQPHVDPNKPVDADAVRRQVAQQSGNYSSPAVYHTRFHSHCYRQYHCCHPRNVFHSCCHNGYDTQHGEYVPRRFYDIRGASCCFGCLVVLLFYLPCWPCLICYLRHSCER